MTKHKSIAVDGPSGAGKSTLAKLLARRLGFLYVDTGAIYRTVGLRAYRAGVDPEDEAAVTALLDGLDIELKYGADGLQHMYLDGEDVTDAIRQHVISRYTSGVSAIPAVRAFLPERQRDMAREHDVIMDGRDIGTVVLPGADVKIFLTASPEDRARRRSTSCGRGGQEADYDTVLGISFSGMSTTPGAPPRRYRGRRRTPLLVDAARKFPGREPGRPSETIKGV